MQSRILAATTTKLHNLVVPFASRNPYLARRSFASGGSGARTADPAIHNEDPEDSYPEQRPFGTPTKEQPPIKENDPFVSPKAPHSPSSRIQSNSVHQPIDPTHQQRRKYGSAAAADDEPLKDVSCVGMDGTPWPEDKMDRKSQIRERVEDDKEYFEHHKASPLSEMEMADTRKPISKATDGTGGGGGYFGGDSGVILWRPEQLETAEDSLLRAKMMWLERATRGDPDSPHGRVLRTLRGESW